MTVGVVVPWRDAGCPWRASVWEWIQARWAALHPDMEITVGCSPEGPFNIAAALNNGIRQASADVLILTGADVVLDPADIHTATRSVEGRWAMLASSYHRVTQADTTALLAGPPDTDTVGPSGEWLGTDLGWGPIVAPRSLLLDPGYDERFVGWGGEDDAFGAAMDTLHGPPVRHAAVAHLLWHPHDRADHAGYPANVALLNLYRAAHGDPAVMRALTRVAA